MRQKIKIRLLAKPAAVSLMSVHENSSTAATKQFATAVRFGKKSILFVMTALLIPIISQADAVKPSESLPSTPRHLTALRYSSLPQNLQTEHGKINLSNDCIDAQGQLTTTGIGKEVTLCPPGYLANEEDVQKTQILGVGSAHYYLRCCKAYVTYS